MRVPAATSWAARLEKGRRQLLAKELQWQLLSSWRRVWWPAGSWRSLGQALCVPWTVCGSVWAPLEAPEGQIAPLRWSGVGAE